MDTKKQPNNFGTRGAQTDITKTNNAYSLFNSPTIFSKENMHIFTGKSHSKFQDLLDKSEISTLNSNVQNELISQDSLNLKFDSNLFAKTKMSKYKNQALIPANINADNFNHQFNKPNQAYIRMPPSNLSINKENNLQEFKPNLNETKNINEANVRFQEIRNNNIFQVVSPNVGYQPFNQMAWRESTFYPMNMPYENQKSSDKNGFGNESASKIQLGLNSYMQNFNASGYKPKSSVISQCDNQLIRKLKKDLQLSPKSKAFLLDLDRKRKENQTKNCNFDILSDTIKILPDIQTKNLWKILFDLAEFMKKDCNYIDAKTYYTLSLYLQPYHPDIWLEYAKMEEDYGNLSKAKEILNRGIEFNPLNENLIVKFLRIEEKVGRIEDSRKILASLRHQSLDKSWKLYLEGALLESKYGNPKSAQRIFKALVKNIDPQGNVYLEYAKFEENMGNLSGALRICYEGISRNIRFSNLWTYFLRISERVVSNINQVPVGKFLGYAITSLPRDMIWKIYLEIASFTERKKKLDDCKAFISKAILSCPENVKWKCFIMGARVELKKNSYHKAQKIINYCLNINNEKQKAQLMIEASKIYEYQGDIEKSIQYFEFNKDYMKNEWKVYLEYIHMLMRNGKHDFAREVTIESLHYHNLAGRLWASIIQLNHLKEDENSSENAYKTFLIAVNEVPKSGEVWCEGARICMNPMSSRFNLEKAKLFLQYAIHFTPQYGDTFVEAIRLNLILGDFKELSQLKKKIVNSQPNYGNVWQFLKKYPGENVHETWKNAKNIIKQDLMKDSLLYRRKMTGIINNNQFNDKTQRILTSSNDYNLILQNKKKMTENEKWKMIFHTDQSIFQQI